MPSTATDRLAGLTTSVAVKAPCKVASTAASLTLSGEQTISGVAVVDGDRVLRAPTSAHVDAGIWVVSTGTWSRAKDWDGARDVVQGTLVSVLNGTVQFYEVSTSGDISPGTTAVLIEASTLAATLDDSSVVVQRSESGSAATTQHVVNQESEILPVAMFGAVGDGTTDDSTAIAAALATGKTVDLGGRTYRIVTKLVASVAGATFRNGTLKADVATTTRLLDITGNNVTFENVTFDGNNEQPRASMVYVDASVVRPRFIKCTFQNILGENYGTTVLNQTYGLNINPYAVTDFLIDGCLFKNIRKRNDGTLIAAAVGLGFAGGVAFLPEDLGDPSSSQPTPTRGIITNCTFNTIGTILANGLTDNQVADYDDGDAIRTYAGTGAKKLNVSINNCKFINVTKRAAKLRASGGNISDCEVYADGNAYGMSTVLDLVHNCSADNVRVYTTSAFAAVKVATISVGGDATNGHTALRDIWASHCKTGVELISVAGSALESFTIDGLELPSVTTAGILHTVSAAATTQRNLTVRRVDIQGSGNSCRGMLLSLADDDTGGWRVRDVNLTNCDYKVEGINNDIRNITLTITSTSFAGSASDRALMELGSGKGLGGFVKATELVFNLAGINTSYTSASRPYLIYAAADNMTLSAVEIIVPEGLSVTYPHFESFGDDSSIDGLDYYGPGYLRMGHLTASDRWSVTNATRHGNGACSQPFWTLNSASDFYLFGGITDFRPTSTTTITSVTATNGVARDIATRSSHGTPTVSGVATTGGFLNVF